MADLHGGHRRRLMQKAFGMGIDMLETHEVIEILLFHIIPRGNTNEIAHRLLNEFGDLYNICHAGIKELTSIEGVGEKTAGYLKTLPTYLKLYELGIYKEKSCLDAAEILMSHIVPKSNTDEIAGRLINKFGNLYNICYAEVNELTSVDGVETKTAEYLKMLPMYARLYGLHGCEEKPYLDTLEKLGDYCTALLMNLCHEELHVLYLSVRKQLIKRVFINSGDSTTVSADYKKIVQSALACKPEYAVVTHNHPNGSFVPSNNDVKFTHHLRDYLKTLNVILLDHIIVADDAYFSFKDKKYVF